MREIAKQTPRKVQGMMDASPLSGLVDRLRHSDPGISARSTSHLFVMVQLAETKSPAKAGLFRFG